MAKKIAIVGGFGAFLLLSMALAQETPPASAGALFGALEGTLNFCAKVDPQSADKYEELDRLFTNDQPEEAIAQVRNSKEYKESLDQTSKQLAALSPKEALALCKGSESK